MRVHFLQYIQVRGCLYLHCQIGDDLAPALSHAPALRLLLLLLFLPFFALAHTVASAPALLPPIQKNYVVKGRGDFRRISWKVCGCVLNHYAGFE